MVVKYNPVFIPGMLFVLTFHGILLYMLWQQRLIPPPEQVAKIFVNFITAPKVEEVHKVDLPLLPEKPKIKPKPKPKLKSKPKKLVKIQQPKKIVPAEPAEPIISEEEVITPPSPPVEVVKASVPEPVSVPAGPVTLTTELSVTCPELSPPTYPSVSRRLGEEGKLVLRVELDENGRVSAASIVESSNYIRLDEAALKVVKTWRCNPALRNGEPVKAIALQPFNFVLQGY